MRNRLKTSEYFRLRLHEEPRVVLVAYDALVADPAGAMARLCACLNLPSGQPGASDGLDGGAWKHAPEGFDTAAISTEVGALCDDLWSALERSYE
ncbi:MAG TPA: hypothetical protein VLE23_12575 [Geminicoccaceae bacterium]|nr:hypothetical protein [Geminicoccaceae bacterium]